MENKILIADDDTSHRGFLKKLLVGCEIDEVGRADDLISRARREKYDLIITDYDMQEKGATNGRRAHGLIVYPEQTGLYAIEKIREFDKETPIIMNSSSDNLNIPISALMKGANEFISKGSSEDEFSRVIGKYLSGINERRYL